MKEPFLSFSFLFPSLYVRCYIGFDQGEKNCDYRVNRNKLQRCLLFSRSPFTNNIVHAGTIRRWNITFATHIPRV